jgi:hypothetical protein
MGYPKADPIDEKATDLSKTNYAFAKRQRDLAKKQKNEAKRLRKAEPAEAKPPVDTGPLPSSEKTVT